MPHHARGGVVPEHPLDAFGGGVGAVAHDHHACVLRVAHAHAAAVVQAHPGGAAGGVEQGVQQRPVADGIAAVLHRFGLAVGAGHRARVEVVAADHDGGLQLAARDHRVEGQAGAVALAQADPADARRQALEGDALAGHVEPAVQMSVVRHIRREQLLHLRIGLADVFRVAAQRDPAKRALATAEQRANVGRHEAGEVERVLDASVERHLADVVAVVHRRNAQRLEAEQRLHVHGAALRGGFAQGAVLCRVGLRSAPALDAPARRQVAIHQVVGGGLVGDEIGPNRTVPDAPQQLRHQLGRVAQQADGHGLLLACVARQARQRVVEIGGLLVEVARAQAEVDAALLALDVQ